MDILFQNGGKKTKTKTKKHLKFRNINFPNKNGKTIFPKEFFHKIWLINKECKYNYIPETGKKSYLVTI